MFHPLGTTNTDPRTSESYFNGNSIAYAYNAASELTSLTYKSGGTTIGDLTYTYDAAGNRIKTGGSFARSAVPPALSTTSYNANNQQTTFGTNAITYDLNGNLATVTDAGVTTTYAWNARNQLAGISATGFAASFAYDSFGRRTGKTIQSTTTNFVYDGLNPVQEKSGGTVTANLLTGLGIDEFLTRTDGVGTRALLPDALGSTVALGDGTGTIQTQYTYEPFGYVSQSGSANTNSYKYTGREDDGTGLYYYRARYYHARLQRFISEDPIGFAGGNFNIYAYVYNSPLKYTDPKGLFGTKSCSYYDQVCGANQGTYECKLAPRICRGAPDNDDPSGNSDKIGNWSECVRQCLQEKHKRRMPYPGQCSSENNIGPLDNGADHLSCWRGCGKNSENPYDPSGPNLPDDNPSLY